LKLFDVAAQLPKIAEGGGHDQDALARPKIVVSATGPQGLLSTTGVTWRLVSA